MMPVLHARESVHRMNELIYANEKTMKRVNGQAFMRELEQIASGPASSRSKPGVVKAVRPRSIDEMKRLASHPQGGPSSVQFVIEE